jgi:O-succinylbenzoate synthase
VWRPDLFDGVTVPRSHWPAAAGDPPPGFDTVKVKMPGGSWPEGYRLRLDFNASVDAETFSRIAETLPRERIDFVEDPCPYDEEVWDRLREQTGLRLALDRASAVVPPASRRLIRRLAADFVVVKPAVEDLPETDLPIIITSYMDHPIGQLHAGYVASAAGRRRISRRDAGGTCTCGLVTHVLYEPDAFIERMTIADGRLVPPDFTELLESLPWKKLS